MKRLLTLLIFAISLQTYAQLPDAFNYQATIRAESGDLLVNTNVNFKVTIFEGQGVGASYQELHFVGSDDLGHVESDYALQRRSLRPAALIFSRRLRYLCFD